MNNRIYHYTKGNNIKSIISDGIIKLIRGFEDMGEQPIVRLTTNSVFEIGILPFEPENNSININQIIKGQNKMICLDQLPNYKRINMKYIIYFILGTIWYAAFFFYNADTFFQQSMIITGYVV